jgi:hypothetical protein
MSNNLILYRCIFALFACFFLTQTAMGQTGSEIRDTDILAQQKKVYASYYPHLFTEHQIKKVETLNNKHSKVYYTVNNINYEAIVNSRQKDLLLVANCEEISRDQVPDIVIDAFYKDFDKTATIINTFRVTTPYSSGFYRIDFQTINSESTIKSPVFYDNKGTRISAPY